MNQETLLKKYFTKSLSKDEEEQFSNLLDKDPDFKVLFDEYTDLNSAFKEHEAITLKDHLKSLESKNLSTTSAGFKRRWFYYSAAAIVLIFLSLQLFNQPSTSSLFNTYYNSYPNVEQPIVRGTQQNTTYDAFKAYENKNFKAAVLMFEKLLNTNNDPNIRFYYAMTLIENNAFEKAKTELESLKSTQNDYIPEIYWYSALINLKENNLEKAKANLNQLKTLKSTFKSSETEALLNILN